MRGSRVDAEVEALFRTHYLVTGNVSASARAVGLPITTGHSLAKRANEDEEFVQARKDMYARAAPDAERMLMSGMELAMQRLNEGPPDPLRFMQMGAKSVNLQDPGPQYLRGLVAGYQALVAMRKLDAEKNGEIKPAPQRIVFVDATSEAEAPPEGPAGDVGSSNQAQ